MIEANIINSPLFALKLSSIFDQNIRNIPKRLINAAIISVKAIFSLRKILAIISTTMG